jgi:phage/plasmid primase-like uncharacterized protein
MERYLCRFCNGKGTIYLTSRDGAGVSTCVVCGGDRTVDWVTNITQKQKINGLNLSYYKRRLTEEGHVYFEPKGP